MKLAVSRVVAALALALAAGCTDCGSLPTLPEQLLPSVVDAGTPDGGFARDAGLSDAGSSDASSPGTPDAGAPASYPVIYPLSPCAPGTADVTGLDAAVVYPLCLVLHRFEGIATVNGAPPTASLLFSFQGAQGFSQLPISADADGGFSGRVMRGDYGQVSFRPEQIGPAHSGSKPIPAAYLTRDVVMNPVANYFTLSGRVTFGGVVPGATGGDDLYLMAQGSPPYQLGRARPKAGNYSAKFFEGQFDVSAQIPFAALGDAELRGYPGASLVNLDQDRQANINVPAVRVGGSVRIDGMPFPDRAPEEDYEIVFEDVQTGGEVVGSYHHAGARNFSTRVPPGNYHVRLNSTVRSDDSLPAIIINKRLATSVSVTDGGLDISADLTTITREGALALDGVPVAANPGQHWFLYTVAESETNSPWFVSYYVVPLNAPSFGLKLFPARYYVLFYLSPVLSPDLAEGWYLFNQSLELKTSGTLPIDIATATVEGTLLIDGEPADAQGSVSGTLAFSGAKGTFYKDVTTQDGRFRVQVPKGHYSVAFYVNRKTYPEYASGRAVLVPDLDLQQSQELELRYDTQRVIGPLSLGDDLNGNRPNGPELELVLQKSGSEVFVVGLEASDQYAFRIPKGTYQPRIRILSGAFENVASGEAQLGRALVVP